MKELTIEEKAQRYDEAIERVNELLYVSDKESLQRKTVEHIFPELAESDDEKIRKALIDYFSDFNLQTFAGLDPKKILYWLEKQGESTDINPSEFDLRLNKLLKQFETLPKKELVNCLSFYLNVVQNDGTYREEKQGEQKPDDNRLIPQKGEYYVCIKDYYSADGKTTNAKGKIYKSPCDGYINDDKGFGLSWINSCTENYFRPIKEEDWIVCEQNNVIGKPLQYKEFMNNKLIQKNIKSLEDKGIVPNFRLWDISDAKDGDVLSSEDKDKVFLYNGKFDLRGRVCAYCGIYKTYDGLCFTKCAIGNYFTYKEPYPATKEQRDLLFQKMKEAGYEWDAEKKVLKKIEQKPAWSEEDEKLQSKLIRWQEEWLSSQKNGGYMDNENLIKSIEESISWLHHIKGRVQIKPQQEWSEEDDIWLNNLICHFETGLSIEYERVASWLKSLKHKVQPQKQWKPSEEYILVVESCMKEFDEGSIKWNLLKELLEQLKQL